MANIGGLEVLIVISIVLLLFGASWLPKLARRAGRTRGQLDEATAEFEKAKTGFKKLDRAVKKTDRLVSPLARRSL